MPPRLQATERLESWATARGASVHEQGHSMLPCGRMHWQSLGYCAGTEQARAAALEEGDEAEAQAQATAEGRSRA